MGSAYRQALKVIEHDPDSATSMALAKLILSLHHQVSLPGTADRLNQMDAASQRLAAVLLVDYMVNGGAFDLTAAGMTVTRLFRPDQLGGARFY